MKYLLLFTTILVVSVKIFAQNDTINYKKDFTQAEFNFYDEDYFHALKIYKKLYKLNPNNSNLAYRIGICYLKAFNSESKKINAIPYLEKAVNNVTQNYQEGDINETRANVDAYVYLGDAYFINEELDKAIETYKSFTSINQENINYFTPIINKKIETCNNAKILKTLPIIITEKNLGEPINNTYSNFNPIISRDGKMLVYTNDLRFYKAIFYSFKKDGQWTTPKNFNVETNTNNSLISLTLSPDGKDLYIYRDDLGNGNIYKSTFDGQKWSKIKKLNKNINTRDLETSACLSADGKTLYFASNRKGGYGSLDIYKSELTADGDWGKAVNLGPTINGKFDEISPQILDDNKTLYFASQGHYNMGGYDVFISMLTDSNKWSEPLNLGYPINTTDDNSYFQPLNNGNEAYVQLAKDNGFGNNDIYKIKLIKPTDKKNIELSGKIKPNTKNTKIEIYDEQGNILETLKPDKKGNFKTKVTSGNYKIKYISDNFNTKTQELTLPKVYYTAKINLNPELNYKNILAENNNQTTNNNTAENNTNDNANNKKTTNNTGDNTNNNTSTDLTKKVVVRNILFGFDKYTAEDTKQNLETLAKYMTNNPEAKVFIKAYTDLQGDEEYNRILSIMRAKFVRDYLVDKGVKPSQISTKGYGEKKQISIDLNPDSRKYNRRAEFVIYKKGKQPIEIYPILVPEKYKIK